MPKNNLTLSVSKPEDFKDAFLKKVQEAQQQLAQKEKGEGKESK